MFAYRVLKNCSRNMPCVTRNPVTFRNLCDELRGMCEIPNPDLAHQQIVENLRKRHEPYGRTIYEILLFFNYCARYLRWLLLEVVANALTGSLTDPKNVYVLRWIAGRRAGVPEFNPPYTIE